MPTKGRLVPISPRSPAAAPTPAWRFLLPAGLTELALLAAAGWWPGADTPVCRAALLTGAFAAYALAASRVKDASGGGGLVWVVAVALRLVLLPLEPSLSHDVYRYLWDGHIQAAGFGPFGRSPLDPELAGLHTPWFNLIPDPGTVTPYRPLTQIAFLAISLIGGAVLQAKLLWIGLDLATAWVLGRIAYQTGRSRRLTQLLWLWSPLLVVEVAWSGHHLPLALFLLTLVVLLARVPAASGMAMGLGAMATPVSLAAAPALLRRGGSHFALGCAAGMAAATLPYALAGPDLVAGLVRPFLHDRLLEGPYLLLESAIPGDGAPRLAALALVLAVGAWAARRRMRAESAFLWVFGAALLLTPVLRPEAALLILPFAALRISRPWILFTGLALVPYVAHPSRALASSSPLPVWVHLAVWVPLLALLGRELLRSWTDRFPPPAGPGP